MWDPKPDAPVEYPRRVRHHPHQRPRHPAHRHAADVRHGSWTSGRSSAACTTTTPATPPATRSASPATRRARTPTRTSTPVAARSSSQQLGHLTPHLPAYVMIPRMVPGHRLGLPRRGPQAVRDAGRPGQRRARSSVPNFELPAGRHGRARSATAASCCTSFDSHAPRRRRSAARCEALDRFGQKAWDILTLAGGPRRVRPRHASRRRSASATASCRRSTPGVRTAAAPRPGASASCWPAGWSRRACGW